MFGWKKVFELTRLKYEFLAPQMLYFRDARLLISTINSFKSMILLCTYD